MDYKRLEDNVINVIKEEQVKLGYREESIRLFYPLNSLNRFLKSECAVAEMKEALQGFVLYVQERLGEILISHKEDRFCLTIPPEGVRYVHDQMRNSEFIAALVELVRRHGCTIEEVLDLFYRYADQVHVEKVDHGEFDYLVYFEDGIPDDFRYCFTEEGPHLIYHRFTPEDYEDFEF